MTAVNTSNAVICTLCCDNETKKSNLIVIAFYFVKKRGNIIQWPKSCSPAGCRLTLHLCSPRWSSICSLAAMAGKPFHCQWLSGIKVWWSLTFYILASDNLTRSKDTISHQCSLILCWIKWFVLWNQTSTSVWSDGQAYISSLEQIQRSSQCYLAKDA